MRGGRRVGFLFTFALSLQTNVTCGTRILFDLHAEATPMASTVVGQSAASGKPAARHNAADRQSVPR